MPLEVWIVLALAIVAGVALGVARLRRKRRAEADREGNIYPLF